MLLIFIAIQLRDALKAQVIVYSEPRAINERGYVVVGSDTTKHASPTQAIVDIAEWVSRAALESIASAGLGHSLDPLNSSSANAYTKAVKDLM
jgi:hypothetical protein